MRQGQSDHITFQSSSVDTDLRIRADKNPKASTSLDFTARYPNIQARASDADKSTDPAIAKVNVMDFITDHDTPIYLKSGNVHIGR
jgi:hypothetical protein